jgi:hypothetical protein
VALPPFFEFLAVRFGIIRSISLQVLGPATWSAALPFNAWNLVEQREQLSDIMTIGTGQGNGQGNAARVGEQMVFTAQFAPICGIWAGFFTPTRRSHRGAVYESAIPIDLVGGLEFCKQAFENTLPNSGPLPLTKAAQAGVAGRKIAGSREPTPRDTGSQDEENAGDNPPWLTWLSTSELNRAARLGPGYQRFQAFPEVIGQNWLTHEEDLPSRSPSKSS